MILTFFIGALLVSPNISFASLTFVPPEHSTISVTDEKGVVHQDVPVTYYNGNRDGKLGGLYYKIDATGETFVQRSDVFSEGQRNFVKVPSGVDAQMAASGYMDEKGALTNLGQAAVDRKDILLRSGKYIDNTDNITTQELRSVDMVGDDEAKTKILAVDNKGKVIVSPVEKPVQPMVISPSDHSSVGSHGGIVPDCDGSVTNNESNTSSVGPKIPGCGYRAFLLLISNIIKFLLYMAIPIASLSFFFAGFLYLTAGGNAGKIEEAHSIFWSALMGIIIMLSAWLIINTILKGLLGPDTGFNLLG